MASLTPRSGVELHTGEPPHTPRISGDLNSGPHVLASTFFNYGAMSPALR